MNVVVLGGTGMLGSMVADCLSRETGFRVIATARNRLPPRLDDIEWRGLDVERCEPASIGEAIAGAEWAVNAIGVIKPHIRDDNPAEVERAVRVNSLFPHLLARAAEERGCRVLQIATDCVYSGGKGAYVETDPHDALDVYGKTKSLGEASSPNVHHLRCSIVGPEPKGHHSLLDWFLRQPRDGRVNGYTNHQWNGITTLHFALLCGGLISRQVKLPHMQHIVPTGTISKEDLLRSFGLEFSRGDVTIHPWEAKTVVDRTLATFNDGLNRDLWKASGYADPPTIRQMVSELARFDFRLYGAPT
jgi:dTDP-4-dehydrorhamnose reductase